MTRKEQTGYAGLLVLTAFIWGIAFVAQAAGNVMGPFTFNTIRFAIGSLVIFVFRLLSSGNLKVDRYTVVSGMVCGILLGISTNLQQIGIIYVSPGKAGFITAFYMIIIPLISIATGHSPGKKTLSAVPAGFAGLYLICIKQGENIFSLGKGELLLIACAFGYSLQMLYLERCLKRAESLGLCFIQFFTASLLSLLLMLTNETFSAEGFRSGLVPLLYAGFLSTGCAYTFQVIGQKHVDPTLASVILSTESCFAVLASWVLLGIGLSPREGIGCALMFSAILITQI